MNKPNLYGAVCAFALTLLGTSATVQAAVIDFHFTGQMTVVDVFGDVFDGQTPVSSTLTYDTATGIGGSTELFIAPLSFIGMDTTFYDISMERIAGTNLILGNMLVDFGTSLGIPLSLVWDASGLLNAIDMGLQAGDVISGTDLKRGGSVIADVGSALPATDGALDGLGNVLNQGPAPMAMTTLDTTPLCTPVSPGTGECLFNPVTGAAPFTDDDIAGSRLIDGPFPGFNINLDIGSGNSLTVLSVSNVPVPAAVWLFGSGLLGLIGMARRKKAV